MRRYHGNRRMPKRPFKCIRDICSSFAPTKLRSPINAKFQIYPTFVPKSAKMMNENPHTSCKFIQSSFHNGIKCITLDRPAKLHALTQEMNDCLTYEISQLQSSANIKAILLNSTAVEGKHIFCAGGDVTHMAKCKDDFQTQKRFFQTEYALNHLIGTSTKPIVAVMNGITMGGGAGLCMHAAFRIATENTVFCMPETAIGFFPDVGASFVLSRLPYAYGVYAGLAGKRISGYDLCHLGIATHFMPASRLHLMHQQLQAAARIDADFSAVIDALAAEYEPLTPRLHHFLTVHRIFSKLSLLEIVAELKKFAQEAPHVADRHWAEETLAELNRMAPSSLAITLEMFKRASSLSFKRCLEMDFVVAQNVLRFSADFYEGVDAKLIRKTGNAAWKPASIAAMNIADITATFVNFNVPNTEKLIFKNITDFSDVSPSKRHAFPSINRDIKEFFKTANAFSHCKTKTHVVEVLCDKFSSPSKLGLKTFFSEIVDVHVFNRDVLFAEYANAAAFVPFGNKEAWLFVENPLLLKKHTLKTHISSL